jgi:hypothetical protein
MSYINPRILLKLKDYHKYNSKKFQDNLIIGIKIPPSDIFNLLYMSSIKENNYIAKHIIENIKINIPNKELTCLLINNPELIEIFI